MPGRRWFALGILAGALAYPGGLVAGHFLFRRSVLYPH